MSRFPTTQWSLIELAHRETPTGSREQMGALLEAYWQPMYAHLRYKGLSNEKAEDLIQEFMMEILNKDLLAIADPKRGKFRTLLLTALDRFAISQHRYETAAKRSPGDISSLDAVETDSTIARSSAPSQAFERAWALDVLAQALAAMKQECESAGQQTRWSVFERRIVGPLLDDDPTPDYAELTEQFGLENDKATMNLLVTAKRQFARTLRDQIRNYVTRAADTGQQVEGIANRLSGAYSNEKTAQRVARQLTEQSITQAVEDEIDQLKAILARTMSAEAVELDTARESMPHKSDFWQRLSQRKGTATSLDRLYEWDQGETTDVPLDVLFQSILSGNMQDLIESGEGTLKECLCGEATSLSSLEGLKEWANIQRASRSQALSSDIASALYYGAIAAALSRHGQKISGLNDQALLTGFRWVTSQSWLDEDVRTTVNSAIDHVSK